MPYGSRAEDSRAAGSAASAQERPPTIMEKQIMIARRIAGSIFWDAALLMRSTRAVKPLHFTFWREHEPVNPHGEEARSAVSGRCSRIARRTMKPVAHPRDAANAAPRDEVEGFRRPP